MDQAIDGKAHSSDCRRGGIDQKRHVVIDDRNARIAAVVADRLDRDRGFASSALLGSFGKESGCFEQVLVIDRSVAGKQGFAHVLRDGLGLGGHALACLGGFGTHERPLACGVRYFRTRVISESSLATRWLAIRPVVAGSQG